MLKEILKVHQTLHSLYTLQIKLVTEHMFKSILLWRKNTIVGNFFL